MVSINYILVAFILDLLIGDPHSWPHPVKMMGRYISFFENYFYRKERRKKANYFWGFLLWLTTVVGVGISTALLLWLSFHIHPILGATCYIYLSYSALATKSLAVEGRQVYEKLIHGTIDEARQQVSLIVGRDTSDLSAKEIANATIETIAENTSDGVVAPLCYLFVGGPVLAMVYKAVNTLDSMVGYQTPKYQEFGYVSAKMDDLWNVIPARITWILLLIASKLLKMNAANAWLIGRRDCRKHKSPNSGYPESVAAGALEIQLGGSHTYHGIEIVKPSIGEAKKEVEPRDIQRMTQLLYGAAILAIGIFSLLASLFY